MKKTKTEIKFEDKPYHQRREILRRYYMSNSEFHKGIKTLAFKIKEKLKEPVLSEIGEIEFIIKFLIDGFLAYEIIWSGGR